jgi:hypothetical protein
MGRQQQRKRQQRRQQARQQARKQARRPNAGRGRTGWIAAGVVLLLLIVGGLAYAATRGKSQASGTTPSPTTTSTAASLAPTVDGIQCGQMEALAYHIHQHIALYDHGKAVPLPYGIGMPGGAASPLCFYWIHVHPQTPNIIHVESPIQKTFTLGDFFDIWKATKSAATPPGDAYVKHLQAAGNSVTAFVDGKRWTRGYRSIPLKEHEVITIEIGKPVVPPRPFTAWNGL